MEGFQVTEIGEKIYCILDAGNSSFYVVEGEEKAAAAPPEKRRHSAIPGRWQRRARRTR